MPGEVQDGLRLGRGMQSNPREETPPAKTEGLFGACWWGVGWGRGFGVASTLYKNTGDGKGQRWSWAGSEHLGMGQAF